MKTAANRRLSRWVFLIFCGVVFICLLSLGNWQVARLEWKLDLIRAAEARANQSPQPLPVGALEKEKNRYQRVMAEGVFLHERERRVKAVTALGPGYWMMTPLQMQGRHVWVNRGFVPEGTVATDQIRPEGLQNIEGLLRFSQPGGTVLEKNDPVRGRWYSPDIPALNEDVGLKGIENYYIDAEHSLPEGAWPRGGMTKLTFRNHHLIYAITWYTMAAMLAGTILFLLRRSSGALLSDSTRPE